MSLLTVSPAVSPFANDPFYALGVADAYDEHAAGEDIHTLRRRADEMLDTASDSVSVSLYVVGYANAVIGQYNTHLAQTTAQADVAHQWLDRKQGRAA